MVNISHILTEVILVTAILIFTWFALWAKRVFFRKMHQRRMAGKKAPDPFTAHILQKGVTILVLFVTILLLLQVFGINVVPLLTVSGISAAIVGFASKDMFSNFFGGLTVYATRPFVVDDFIDIPGKSVTGTVEEIGWYLTEIRDLQKKLLFIPNSVFSTEVLINYSRMTHRRIEEVIRVRDLDKSSAESVVDQIRLLLKEHPEIDQKEQVHVYILSVSPWGMQIDLKAYTKTTQYQKFMEIKEAILLEINKIVFEKNL